MEMRLRRASPILALVWLTIGPDAASQSISGSISGIVRDEQRAVLPGATVTIRRTETGSTRTAQADASGEFRVVALPPGTYEVTIELVGFAETTLNDVPLGINASLNLAVVLRVAGVKEQLDVVLPIDDATRTAPGRTIRPREIDALPVLSRDFSTLAQLTPGILINRSGLAASPTNPGIASAGQFSRNNRLIIDGLLFDRLNTGFPSAVTRSTRCASSSCCPTPSTPSSGRRPGPSSRW